ncbi:hypothetical protein D9M71_464240 [compost metagenome]
MAVGLGRVQLLAGHAETVRGVDQVLAKVGTVVRVGNVPGWHRADVAEERSHVRGDARDIGAGQGQDRMLRGELRQRRHLAGIAGQLIGDVLIHRQADLILRVEHNHITVAEAECTDFGAAVVAADCILANAFDMAGRMLGATRGAELGDKRIAVVASLDEAHDPGRSGQRRDAHALDRDRHGVADLRPGDGHRLRHFMAALEGWRDHRPPATWRRPGDQRAAVCQRAEHRLARANDAVGVAIDPQAIDRRGVEIGLRHKRCHGDPLRSQERTELTVQRRFVSGLCPGVALNQGGLYREAVWIH